MTPVPPGAPSLPPPRVLRRFPLQPHFPAVLGVTGGPERGRVGSERGRRCTHLSPSGPPHHGHPLLLAGGLRRSLRVWRGSRDGRPVKLLTPSPSSSSSAGHQILPPKSPQGSKGHTRVGDGACPPTPKSPAPRWATACSYGLVSVGLGTRGPAEALHWRVSPQFGGPRAPEVTEPSRLVVESSGGEVRKQQLDTRVRQEPPGGPVSRAG